MPRPSVFSSCTAASRVIAIVLAVSIQVPAARTWYLKVDQSNVNPAGVVTVSAHSGDGSKRVLIVLHCASKMPGCVAASPDDVGLMEDISDPVYKGRNVRVEYLDGGDGSHNIIGIYQLGEMCRSSECE